MQMLAAGEVSWVPPAQLLYARRTAHAGATVALNNCPAQHSRRVVAVLTAGWEPCLRSLPKLELKDAFLGLGGREI